MCQKMVVNAEWLCVCYFSFLELGISPVLRIPMQYYMFKPYKQTQRGFVIYLFSWYKHCDRSHEMQYFCICV